MKKSLLAASIIALAGNAFAGGYLTNTNQSIYFLRNPARDALLVSMAFTTILPVQPSTTTVSIFSSIGRMLIKNVMRMPLTGNCLH